MSLRHAVLGLLADRPSSGYDLMGVFDQGLAYAWPAHQSQVYGELAKLTARGLADVADVGPRGRKEYSITDAGRAELRRWLATTAPERVVRYEPILRSFFLWTLSAPDREAYLATYRDEATRYVEQFRHLESSVRWDDTGPDRSSRLALGFARRIAEASASWATWALEQEGELTAADERTARGV